MKHHAVIGLALLLSACAAGPDFERPAPPEVADYRKTPAQTAGEDQRLARGAEVPARWWEAFGSAGLNALIDEALKANPDLEALRAALRVAQENARAQSGAYWPQVGASINSTRQRVGRALSSPLDSGADIFNMHTGRLSVGYTPDVFGANRRAVESLEAQRDAQRFELEAARLTLAANVANAAIQEAALRGQIAATERLVALQQEVLAMTRRSRELGAVSELAVAAQETAAAQTQASLPPFNKQLAQTRDLLAALVGRLPAQEIEQSFDLASLQLPRELPLSLPSRLVEQRPDVRAAEAQAHAASAQIGVATAVMLPQITLDAERGSVATHIADLFKAGTGFWSLTATATQPIFQGGQLMHRKAAAEATYDQAMAQYRATVIAAFQNVADTLHALEQDAQAQRATASAEAAAARSLALARRQFELGDISHLALLNAEQAWLQARLALIQASANRYADCVALFQALGGGWWNQSAEARS